MKKQFIFAAVIFILAGCSQNNHNSAEANNNNSHAPDSSSGSFFPVSLFLQGQINLIDSVQATILQVTTHNNKADSVWLSKEKVKPLLAPFTIDGIDKDNLVDLYKETRFNDQSTEAITLMYSPKPALPGSASLRNWTVYIHPDRGSVKSIYIVRQLLENGIPVTRQLTWQCDKWAKIVTIKDKPGGKASEVDEIKWVWSFE